MDVNNLKHKKIFLNVISITTFFSFVDFVLTFIGLNKGYFIESNYFALQIYQNNKYIFAFGKIGVTIFFFCITTAYVFICQKNHKKTSKFITGLIFLSFAVYTIIIVVHIIYLFVVF